MRIGIYNPAVGTRKSGGTETFLRELMGGLQHRHEIVLFTGEGKLLSEVAKMRIKVIQLPYVSRDSLLSRYLQKMRVGPISFDLESLSIYLKARKIVEKERLDILSTHYYLDNLLLSKSGIPTVFRFPGIKTPSIRWRKMVRNANTSMYLSNSNSTVNRVERWFGIDVKGVVYPGVDVEQFYPYYTDGEGFTILYVGRIDYGKRIEDLINLAGELSDKINVLVVGDGPLLEFYRSIAYYNNVKNIKFVGEVPHSELPYYYNSCDVFCLPSEHEGFPVVVLEAMACGKPVVCTNLDSTREQIIHGKEGFLFSDFKELLTTIEYLYSNESEGKWTGRKGRKKVVKYFTWQEQVDQMEEFYEEVC